MNNTFSEIQVNKKLTSTIGILAALSVSLLASSIATSIANIALPTLAKAFSASFQEVQWVVLGYNLVITTLIVSVGKFGDTIGSRQLFLSGVLIFTLASFLCGIAGTLAILIASKALQGLGVAIITALSFAFVSKTIKKEKTGSVMGLLGTMFAIGTATAPAIGGLLIEKFNWSAVFFLEVPFGILAFILVYIFLPKDELKEKENKQGFDILGTIILSITLGSYTLGMTFGKTNFGTINLILLVVAIIGIVAFVYTEKRIKFPLIQMEILKDKTIASGLLMAILVMTVLMATLIIGPFYLSQSLQLPTEKMGYIVSIGPIVAASASLFSGKLVDYFGSRLMAFTGLSMILIAAISFFLIPMSLGIAGYITPLIVMTSGYALFQTANNTAVMVSAGEEQKGLVSGMLNLARNFGIITGTVVMGKAFTLACGTKEITAAGSETVAIGLQYTFGFATLIIISAIIVWKTSRYAALLSKDNKE